MKPRFTLLAVAFLLLFISCNKENIENPLSANNNNAGNAGQTSRALFCSTTCGPMDYCGDEKTVILYAGQHINAGQVRVVNTADSVYVTYTATAPWYIAKLNLYVGALSGLPLNNAGNPVIGHFPYAKSFDMCAQTSCYTFAIAASSLPSSFIVAAHADLVKLGAHCCVAQSETGWGSGTQINCHGNWGMYFNYTKQCCAPPVVEGCSYSPQHFFFKPKFLWTSPADIGGFSYTEGEAAALYACNDNGHVADSKHAWMLVGAIRLSGSSVNPHASVWPDVNICETYLRNCGKLSPDHLPTGNQQVADACARIENWFRDNHCE